MIFVSKLKGLQIHIETKIFIREINNTLKIKENCFYDFLPNIKIEGAV